MPTTTERVVFRLISTPCCGSLLCWVNPRLPNFCPECAKPTLAKLRTDGSYIIVTDNRAMLKTTSEHPLRLPPRPTDRKVD